MKAALRSLPSPALALTETLPIAVDRATQSLVNQCVIGLQMHFSTLHDYWLRQFYIEKFSYINDFFKLINLFCEQYELDQSFFDFLDKVAVDIERLARFSFEKKQLVGCFEKVAMIYQIVADKTEYMDRKISFIEKAKQYIEKADEARKQYLQEDPLSISHEEKMSRLFRTIADDCEDAPFNKPYFEDLANKYEKICEQKMVSKALSSFPFFQEFSQEDDEVRQRFSSVMGKEPLDDGDETTHLLFENKKLR